MNKEELQKLVDGELSQRKIAEILNTSQTNIRYWLKQYGITTIRKRNIYHYCKTCGETNSDNFYGDRKSQCKTCANKNTSNILIDKKKRAIEYKGGKCVHCGYDRYYGALDFHHLDPNEKECNWKELRMKTWSDIIKELDKCILLCKNCHAEEHQ